jgi:hypothetical protein
MKKGATKVYGTITCNSHGARLLNLARRRYSLILATALAAPYVGPCQPSIVSQPTNQSVSLGASASFTIAATTTSPPIHYQCQFAGTDLSAATNSALVLTNIQQLNSGDYDVVVNGRFRLYYELGCPSGGGPDLCQSHGTRGPAQTSRVSIAFPFRDLTTARLPIPIN